MASEGGGKIKSKRGNSTSKPYERRKSLFRRITDSIKDVLRPSWLPNDDNEDGDPSTSGRPGTSSGDDGEEQFLSPPQSPSQLLGHNSQGLTPSERLYPQLPHPDPSHAPGNASVAWQQGASGWQGQGQGTRSSTWGNNVNAFDKSQFTPNYFGQKHMAGARQTDSMPEIAPSPRGLGGPAPITPSASTSTPTGHRRLVVPQSGVSSSSQRDDGQGRASAGPSFSPSASPSLNSEDNPTKRQRLWSPEALRRGTALSATQQRLWSPERKGSLLQPAVKDKPAFKISVFSSPSLNESSHESSFYSGRTTYGGASAYSRQSFNSSLPYQNSLPLRKSVKAKPLNNSGNAVLSSSATQILKTLERLSDAKRSRANDTESESLLSFTPSSYRKASRPLQTSLPSRSLELPVPGPPTHQLNTPVAASIAKNRQIISLPARRPHPPAATATCSNQDDRRQDVAHMDEGDEDVRVVRVEKKPAQATATSSSAVGEGPSAARSSGKMKHPKSYDTRPKAAREEDEVVEIPNLRTDFTLPISAAGFSLGLPTVPPPSYSSHSFCSSSSSSTFSATYASTPFRSSGHSVATKTSTSMSIQSPPSVNAHFTFSSPIQKSAPGRSGFSPASTEDFQFSSPLKVSDSIQASSYKSAMTSTIGSSPMSSQSGFTPAAWGSTAPKPKSSFTGNAQASPVTSSYGGIMSPSSSSDRPVMAAPELKFGSVMDILGGGNKSPVTSSPSGSGFQPASQLKQGSVMDILGGTSSTEAASTSSGSTAGDSLFAKFTAPAGTWDCDACMLQNKPDAAKCVACETPKPGTKQSAPFTSSGSGSTGGDSLFAKFTAPAGTWDCDACMLQNKPDAAKCVACETPKPGSAPAKPSAPASDLMAKFRPPQGSWECDVCMVQNTGANTKCLACETPRPGTQATGSVPPPAAPAPGVVGPSGGLILSSIPTSSSGASPFLLAAASGSESSSTGFKFGAPPSSSSSSLPAAGGFMFGASSSSAAKGFGATSKDSSGTAGFKFGTGAAGTTDSSTEKSKFGTSSTGAKDTSGTAGFQFGSKDTSNSNSASSTAGFQFGAKDSTDANGPLTSAGSAVKVGAGADSKLTSSTATGSGFQFGAPSAPSGSGFVFGAPSKTSPAQGSASSTSASALPGGFSFKTPSEAGVAQTQSKDSSPKSVDKLTSAQETGKEGNANSLFSPVFGVGKPSNSFSLGAAPSLAAGEANSVTGGFSFGATASNDSAAPSVFGSGLTSKVTFSGSDASKAESRDSSAKAPSLAGGFSFAAAAKTNNDTSAKPGLFSSLAPDSSSKNGPSSSVAAPASSGSAGFAFGGNATTASPFGSGAQLGAGGFGSAPSAAKPVVNGEVAAPGMFAFGQQTSTSTAGFSFATPAANTKDGVVNAAAQAKSPFAFGGADSGKSGKRRLDNDLGPGEAKKSSFSMTGAPSLGEGDPFKFSNTTAAGGTGMFKFGQPSDGPAEKAPNITAFGGQASGFGSAGTPGGFSFSNPQTNAASSTRAPAPSLFGAGTGSTNTGQFSFSVGAGSQSNAAAASPFGSGASAPLASSQGAGGFNFAGATQPSFNFGAANTAPPVFAFGAPSGEPAPAQPAPSGGVFAFGQTAPSADSTSSFTAPGPNPAPNAMGFGAAPAQTNFNIGTGSEARKIKRAVRRTVRK